jgi:putative addiction module killer protein
MIAIRKTPEFAKWLHKLRDERARERIIFRLLKLEEGHPGDHKYVGEGVWELRLQFGPGYRVYYTQRGQEWILLLAGSNKGSQERDIRLARKLAKEG